MSLHVQDYLRSGKTLQQLDEEFRVSANGIAIGDSTIVSLNYSVFSDMKHPIPRECRGLILETKTWNIVSRSFNKFFNLGETDGRDIEDKFDWTNYKVQEKLDGSLIQFYFYNNQWNISTRKSPDASGRVNNRAITFAQLVREVMPDDLLSRLNPKLFYSFELTTTYNRVLVKYSKPALTLIGVWNALEEVNIDEFDLPKVKLYSFKDLNEIQNSLVNTNPEEIEGYVLVDSNHNRLKIKSESYLKAFRLCSSLESSPEHVIEYILSNTSDDTLQLLPQEQVDKVLATRQSLQDVINYLNAIYPTIYSDDRKTFAMKAKAYGNLAHFLFKMYDGETAANVIQNTRPKNLLFTYKEKQ